MAMPWEADVLRKLELRDRSQCFAFSELIESRAFSFSFLFDYPRTKD